MPNLTRLHEEHASLATIAGQLAGMIAQKLPPPSQQLYAVRMELASVLIRHLKTEDWLLYPALLASSDERTVLTSRAFSAQMGGLAKAFDEYAKRWGANAIQDDWKGYQLETADILRLLALRMAREERDLYPLFEVTAVPLNSSSSRLRA